MDVHNLQYQERNVVFQYNKRYIFTDFKKWAIKNISMCKKKTKTFLFQIERKTFLLQCLKHVPKKKQIM